jgi:hypothetical protein
MKEKSLMLYVDNIACTSICVEPGTGDSDENFSIA